MKREATASGKRSFERSHLESMVRSGPLGCKTMLTGETDDVR